jgi:acetyl-CoA carboxylase biotin carboxyl carrier protein
MALTFQEVDQILRIVEEFPANEVRFEYGDLKLHIRRPGMVASAVAPAPGGSNAQAPVAAVAAAPASASTPAAAPAASAAPAAARALEREGQLAVSSPMMGVYYAAPAPDAPPFVQAGQDVSEGTDLCIIEVMKIMNTVKAPCAGTVIEVVASNGQTVQSGAPLFWIRPRAGKGAR